MGFRTTLTTQDYNITWPDWFVEKYKHCIYFGENNKGSLHTKFECKTYESFVDLPNDIQKSIDWDYFLNNFVMVYLHECGGITRCQIERDSIKWSEPETWNITDGVSHHYCIGCSDI